MKYLLLLAFLVACNRAPKPAPYRGSLDDAIAESERAHKPLIALFSATWCGACRDFDADVLPDARVQAALANHTFVRFDIDSANGEIAAAEVDCEAIPLLVRIDERGIVHLEDDDLSAADVIAFLARK